jgi:hypothetical protein
MSHVLNEASKHLISHLNTSVKIGANDPCPWCGSGKKYKKCCRDKSPEEIGAVKALAHLDEATSGFKLIPALRRVSVTSYALLQHDGYKDVDGKPVPADDFAEIAKRLTIHHDEHGKDYTHEDHLKCERLVISAPTYRFISDVDSGKASLSLVRMGFYQHRYYHFMMHLVGRAALLYQFFPELQAGSSQFDLHQEIKRHIGMTPAEFIAIGTQALVVIQLTKGLFRKDFLDKAKGKNLEKFLTKEKIDSFLSECSITPEKFIEDYQHQQLPRELFGFEFNPLVAHPIIKTTSQTDGENYIVPVAYLLLYKFTEGLFHTIISKYEPDEAATALFRSNYGKHIFEPYVLRHLREAVSRKKIWPNFPLQRSNRRAEGEIDLVFCEGDTWFFLETTVVTASIGVQQVRDEVAFLTYIKRLASKVKQLKKQHDFFESGQMVLPKNAPSSGRHHCILVTLEDLPYPNLLIRHFLEVELQREGINTFPYHILHIAEYETLCDVAKRTGFREIFSKKEQFMDGFDILNERQTSQYLASSKLKLKASTEDFSNPDVPDWSDSIYSDMQEFLDKHYSRNGMPPYSKLLQDSYYRMYAELGFTKSGLQKWKRKYWPRFKAFLRGY